MADKKVKATVLHKKYYLAVDGKLQHVPSGTEIETTEAAVKASRGKLILAGGPKKTVKVGKQSDDSKE